MYTYNNYVFGHQLSVNKELNNELTEFDYEFSISINNKSFEISTPYHGGQCSGDVYSVIFGHVITDDDQNPDFVNEIRNAKEEDYIKEYLEFIKQVKVDLIRDKGLEKKYDEFCDKLITFIDSTKHTFYSVEASS